MKQLEFTTLLSTLTPPAVMARVCLGMFRCCVTDDLPNITVPILIIGTNKDLLTRPDASEHISRLISGAQLVLLQQLNHEGLLERHKEVNEAAANFIKGPG